jgi:hypothetical protein
LTHVKPPARDAGTRDEKEEDMDAMTFFIFAAAAMAAVSLFSGVNSMAHGGEADAAQGNHLMFQRVAWQGLAVALVILALLAS